MPNILLYIITAIAIGALIGVFIKISDFIKGIYLKVALFSHRLTLDANWYYDDFLNRISKLGSKLRKKDKERKLDDFGGIGRLIIMIVLLGLSVVMGFALYADTGNTEELLLELGLNAPPMFLFSIIFNAASAGEFSIFNFTDMVQTAIVGAILIAFFRRDKDNDIHDVVRVIYSAIFSAFFLLLSYFIPSEIFLFPLGILSVFTDIFSFLGNMITSYPLGILGILLAAITVILYLSVVLAAIYAIFCLFVVTIREFIASVLISLIPTVIFFLVVLIVNSIFPGLSNAWGNIILVALVLVLMVVSNFIRSSMDEEAENDADFDDSLHARRRETKAMIRESRAIIRGKSVYNPEDPTAFIPLPVRIYRSVKHAIAESYRKNA